MPVATVTAASRMVQRLREKSGDHPPNSHIGNGLRAEAGEAD